MSAARAFLDGGRVGDALDRLDDIRRGLADRFAEAGARRVEPETLQPADLLLDLYGEDIRARAFTVRDPASGELCLRPDFTVPVARIHMDEAAGPARYAYDGPVWRRQDPGSPRPTEFIQAGIELIGGADPAADDAEAFALIRDALGGLAASVVTGDLAIIRAAIDGLRTTAARKAALRRHIWRPARFHRLLDRYAAPPPPGPARAALLAEGADLDAAIAAAGKFVGLRGADEIAARIEVLREEAATPPLSAEQKDGLEAVLAVAGPAAAALARLRGFALPALAPALDAMERRLEALAARGVDLAALPFDAAFGRSLEYYDGFVFEFRAADPALPPLGGGGRYDALTAILGGGAGVRAVGGMVRPEAMAAAEGGP